MSSIATASPDDPAMRLQLAQRRFAEIMADHRKWQTDWVVALLKAQLT